MLCVEACIHHFSSLDHSLRPADGQNSRGAPPSPSRSPRELFVYFVKDRPVIGTLIKVRGE